MADTVSISVSGDYHIYGKFDSYIRKFPDKEIFDNELVSLFSGCDWNIFNLEDPISERRQGILKFGPHGVGSKESIVPIIKAGFNTATFATNHTFDMGDEGIMTTIDTCRANGIDVIGAGISNKTSREIKYRTIKDLKIAVLNFSRVEFNVSNVHGGANQLDTIDNVNDILEAKKNADAVFVIIHEGIDLFELPYPLLVKQMRFYADMGASAIILHHSRIVSGYEIYKGVPIFYGIGNLLHISKNENEHKGLIVKFQISRNNLQFQIFPIKFDEEKMQVVLFKTEEKNEVLKKIQELSEIICDHKRLQEKWEGFLLSKKELYLTLLTGYPMLFYKVAKKTKLLFIYRKLLSFNKRKYLSFLNILRCQTHEQNTRRILELIYKEKL